MLLSHDPAPRRHATSAATLAAQPPEALRDTKRAVNLHILQQGLVHLEFGSMAESGSFDTDAFGRRANT